MADKTPSETPVTDAAILRTVNIYVAREDGSKRMVFELVEASVARQLELKNADLAAKLAEAQRDAERYVDLCEGKYSMMPRIVPPFLQDPRGLTRYKDKAAIDEAIREAKESARG